MFCTDTYILHAYLKLLFEACRKLWFPCPYKNELQQIKTNTSNSAHRLHFNKTEQCKQLMLTTATERSSNHQ